MKMTTMSWIFLSIFVIGIFFVALRGGSCVGCMNVNEGFTPNKCQNLLIQKGAKFYLYNTNQVEVPGVNPIEFDHLEDYTEFLQWQKSQGIVCPVLYLQSGIDAQGNTVLQSRPSVSEPQGGLGPGPAIIPPPTYPYNNTDSSTTDSSTTTGKKVLSPDPMDDNWGGAEYTESVLAQGYYKGNEVAMYTP